MHKEEFKNSIEENIQKMKDIIKVGIQVQIPNYSLAAGAHYMFEKISSQEEKLVLLPILASATISLGAYILRARFEVKKGILQKN